MSEQSQLLVATMGLHGAAELGTGGTIVSVGDVVIQEEELTVTFDPDSGTDVKLPDGSTIEVSPADFSVEADPEFVDVEESS